MRSQSSQDGDIRIEAKVKTKSPFKNPFQSSKIKIGSKLGMLELRSPMTTTYEKALNTENAVDVTYGSARNFGDAFDTSDDHNRT
jgi:hypothetical protein